MKNPEDAKKIHHAVVYKQGRAAATLTRHARAGVVFSYLPSYLSSGGPAIASTLPALDVPVTLGHGSVPAFFAGLLPEGERLAKLRWAVKTTITDELVDRSQAISAQFAVRHPQLEPILRELGQILQRMGI